LVRVSRLAVPFVLLATCPMVALAQQTGRDSTARPNPDSALSVQLRSRLETKGERVTNDRCAALQSYGLAFRCSGSFQPTFDFQFNLLSAGRVGDRVRVDVDYDTQREFDASNTISLRYQGDTNAFLRRVEVGNVSWLPPVSRFITAGIPSGNYGVQASGKLAGMSYSAIAAQQKGNVIRDLVFTMGDRTVKGLDHEIEDYQIEPRRFFFTVDPQRFGTRYPNVDILDRQQMASLAAALPDSVRPARVSVYRLLLGGQPRNPNGPRFRIIGDPTSQRGEVYELLREQLDYYIDPSQLWIALVTPLSATNERLVVAYTVRLNGRDTTIATTGGTPDLAFIPGREQFANLLWDPRVTPTDAAFRREIRSVYRLGGEDLRRETVRLTIVTGTGSDQEKPAAGSARTYLEMFGLSQVNNPSTFDIENRLWPRPSDPNVTIGVGGASAQILRDQFVIFPSLEPFARRGLAQPAAVPANDSIYRTPSEYLYTPQHPPSFYRLRARYDADGGTDRGSIMLNAVQLRPGSERILIDGRTLIRGVDYLVDYDIGRVMFTHADTLFAQPRQVTVRYEENPQFTSIPTTIYGLTTQWTVDAGTLGFTAISQSQRSTFTRPQLGFEPASSVVAGVNAAFHFDAGAFGRALSRWLPAIDTGVASRVELSAEFAVSKPRPNATGQAYIESFDAEGGLQVPLDAGRWYYSSQPALGNRLAARFGASTFDTTRATTLAWQSAGTDRNGRAVSFRTDQIDPQTLLVGSAFSAPEPMLWLTLYPLRVGGLRDPTSGRYRWELGTTPGGRRWRSIRTPLGFGGADLTRAETIEFWTLIDTSAVRRTANPTLVLDFGEVSENSVVFAPDTMAVRAPSDTTFTGKKTQGFDTPRSERDAFSRAFNADVNDIGLPGDVVDRLTQVNGTASTLRNVPICSRGIALLFPLGDARDNCTVRNSRLDETDLDGDGVLNLPSARREDETVRRYVIDLADPRRYTRIGTCGAQVNDINSAAPAGSTLCWVNIKVPFNAPDDSTGGGPLLRKVRALRVTMVSGATAGDGAFTMLPLARFQVIGSPWLKRSDRPLRGLGGADRGNGFVIATVIGTQDRDTLRGVPYEPPPGVGDEPDSRTAPFDPTRVQINERSMRLLAGGLEKYDRAEAFFRFPEGERSFMSYKELRLWARGRGNGWGTGGELQFFVKIGRDGDNFYLYRTAVSSGSSRAAWEPEIHVRFEKFFALRARLQNAYARRSADSISCTGADSALIVRSGLPLGGRGTRYAACADGYIVYSVDPAVTPPNLSAVQELAVGIVRVDSARGANPVLPGDTLEVWVDELRLADVVDETGFAGQVSASINAGDFASLRVSATRRDPNFRQLGESPTFLTNNDLEIASTWRLDKLLPRSLGVALPFTITHIGSGANPQFLTRSDLEGDAITGLRTPKTAITTYALSVRRLTPLTNKWYAPIVNHLGVTGTFVSTGNRSEFEDGHARNANVGLDYVVFNPGGASGDGASSGPVGRLLQLLPAWGPLRPLATGAVRLDPTAFRLTSGMVRNDDRRATFLTPAGAPEDSARTVTGKEYVWRAGTSLELQPVSTVTARWDFASLRDLRNYGDSTPNGLAASAARRRAAGLDVGLERERQVQTSVTFTPHVAAWFTPRMDLTTSYRMLRDPNARSLAPVSADTAALTLPRRMGNTQMASAGGSLDLGRAFARWTGDSTRMQRVVAAFRPVDVNLSRNVLSAFDGTGAAAGIGYQFGIGAPDDFRRVGASLATTAAVADQLSIANTVALPLHLALSHRYQRVTTRNWTRRADSVQTAIDGVQRVLPDLTLRWAPPGTVIEGFISSAALSARMQRTRSETLLPADLAGIPAESRATRITSWPLSGSMVWVPGEVTASAMYTYSQRIDSLPGSVTTGDGRDLNAELSRAFTLPQRWGVPNPVRTRVSYQQTLARSFVSNIAAVGAQSRLTDNGRRAFNVNAGTDLSETLIFSLQGSRVVNFDRNFNRQFTQTVLSAVLQMNFFAGALR
jgi:hypothetical protein